MISLETDFLQMTENRQMVAEKNEYKRLKLNECLSLTLKLHLKIRNQTATQDRAQE